MSVCICVSNLSTYISVHVSVWMRDSIFFGALIFTVSSRRTLRHVTGHPPGRRHLSAALSRTKRAAKITTGVLRYDGRLCIFWTEWQIPYRAASGLTRVFRLRGRQRRPLRRRTFRLVTLPHVPDASLSYLPFTLFRTRFASVTRPTL